MPARPDPFRDLVLVAPMGIRPDHDAIYDQFLVGSEHYAQRAYHRRETFDRIYGEVTFVQLEAWETDREMVCRVAWKPYMHDPTLEPLLRSVDLPAVIVHCDDDRIVPRECSDRYAAALPRAQRIDLAACGHAAEVEGAEALARIVNDRR